MTMTLCYRCGENETIDRWTACDKCCKNIYKKTDSISDFNSILERIKHMTPREQVEIDNRKDTQLSMIQEALF